MNKDGQTKLDLQQAYEIIDQRRHELRDPSLIDTHPDTRFMQWMESFKLAIAAFLLLALMKVP